MGSKENNNISKEKDIREEEYSQLHSSPFINGLVKDIKKNASDTFIDMDLKDLPPVK